MFGSFGIPPACSNGFGYYCCSQVRNDVVNVSSSLFCLFILSVSLVRYDCFHYTGPPWGLVRSEGRSETGKGVKALILSIEIVCCLLFLLTVTILSLKSRTGYGPSYAKDNGYLWWSILSKTKLDFNRLLGI